MLDLINIVMKNTEDENNTLINFIKKEKEKSFYEGQKNEKETSAEELGNKREELIINFEEQKEAEYESGRYDGYGNGYSDGYKEGQTSCDDEINVLEEEKEELEEKLFQLEEELANLKEEEEDLDLKELIED